MRAGTLRDRVRIERVAAVGGGYQWVPVDVVFADVRAASPGRDFTQTLSHTATIRYREDIEANMRLRLSSKILWVVAPPADPDGRHQRLELSCRERSGDSCTFTFTTSGTEDATTGNFSGGGTSTITGQITDAGDGNVTRYQQLNLIVSKARTLFFVPDTPGSMPPLDSKLSWGTESLTVKDVAPYMPNGVALFATIVAVSA